MDTDFLDKIMKLQRAGARIVVRRKSTGNGRVKVIAGPFGVMTRRFDVNLETFEAVKRLCLA